MSTVLIVKPTARCDVCDRVAVVTIKAGDVVLGLCRKHGFEVFMGIENVMNDHSSPDDD